ncbi:MAG: acyl-CoA dehydrogenase family protein [Spongiibacteraceae bacterium]
MINNNNYTAQSEDLSARLKPLLPMIQQYADQNHQNRDVAPEVVKAISDAGLFRCFQPKRWGGAEADPRTLYQLQNLIAQRCASTAWIFGVLSVQSFVLSLMDEQAQADVWGENPSTLVSSSFMPAGKVVLADGGFRLSGQWAFSSGCQHADWVILGGLVPSVSEGQPPSMQLFLLPRSDYQIIDTWDTFGLRGTGSHDIAVDDAFVPGHRCFQPSPGIVASTDSSDLPALYQLPWLYMFTSTVANIGIGIAQAGLQAFLAIERKRLSFTGKPSKDDPAVMSVAARLSAAIEGSEAMLDRHISNMLEGVESATAMSMQQGLLQRTQLTSMLRDLALIIDEMQLLLGGRGIRNDSPLTRIWLDMCAARAHPGNNPDMIAPTYGKLLLD